MSTYTLSTGEAVQAVLEGHECESEGEFSWKMSLHGDTPCILVGHTTQCVRAAHVRRRWRLVPTLVKREEALRALATGKTIKRGGRSWTCCIDWRDVAMRDYPSKSSGSGIIPSVQNFAADFLDDSACWEILP